MSINKKIASGSVWMVASRLAVKSISIISTIILVRYLDPSDFGIVALAMSIIAFFELLRAFGFDTVLIQNQKATSAHYNTSWTIQVIFSFFIAVLLFLTAPFIISFYEDSRLKTVIYMVALNIIIYGFVNIGIVDFRKHMNFSKEFKFGLIVKICGFIVTIPIAVIYQSYWALLFGMLSTNIASLLFSYWMHPFRPVPTLSKWREIMGFSSWLLLNNFIYFLNIHSQNIIVGKTSGNAAVGSLTVSFEIATIATTEMVAPINRAAFPGYAKLSDDLKKLKDTYLNVLPFIALISLPVSFGIVAIAPLFVPVLLGEKWLHAIPVIQILALSATFESLNSNSSYIYLALKKIKLLTFLMLIRLSIFIPLLIIVTPDYGATGAAAAVFIASAAMFPIYLLMIFSVLKIHLIEFFSSIYRCIISALCMGFIVNFYTEQFPTNEVNIAALLLGIVLGAITFGSSLLILWYLAGKPQGAESTAIDFIRSKIISRFL